MARLTTDDIKNVAYLARIKIAEADIDNYIERLSSIFSLIEASFMKQIDGVNLDDIQPMLHPLAINQPLRRDQVTEQNNRELFQSLAPAIANHLYIVNKVVE